MIIARALSVESGLILTIDGSEANRRATAQAALASVKREMIPDLPEVLDLVIKPLPGTTDQLAIIKLPQDD